MSTRRAVLGLAAGFAASRVAAAPSRSEYWPTASDWSRTEPASIGFDPVAIGAAVDAAMADRSAAILILRGGRIVAERYATGRNLKDSQEVASVGKSFLSVLVGVAIDEGKIKNLDQSAADFVPGWVGTPKAAITIRHLLTMTSGLDDTGLALRNVTGDQFAINAAAPLLTPPGSHWHYNTAAYHLIFHLLEKATGVPFATFAQRALLSPLGMTDASWITNEGQGREGPVTNYYTAKCSSRDLGRFGLFALRGGRWRERRLVSKSYFEASISPSQDLNPAYGYLWWQNSQPGYGAAEDANGLARRFDGSPDDTFAALGAGGQLVAAIPSLDLVVVRQGRRPSAGARARPFLAAICAALNARSHG